MPSTAILIYIRSISCYSGWDSGASSLNVGVRRRELVVRAIVANQVAELIPSNQPRNRVRNFRAILQQLVLLASSAMGNTTRALNENASMATGVRASVEMHVDAARQDNWRNVKRWNVEPFQSCLLGFHIRNRQRRVAFRIQDCQLRSPTRGWIRTLQDRKEIGVF